jgi:nitroreductase
MITRFLELAEKRYSARAYRPDAVPEPVVARLLDALRLAPTAANRQPLRAILIPTCGRAAELRRIYDKDWFALQPPLVVAVCTEPAVAWVRRDGRNYADVDAAIAMDHLVLAATDEGLGTCWVGAFDPVAAREVLRLPEGVEPIAFTPLGYPADEPKQKRRKPLSEIVYYGVWGQTEP